MTILPLKVQTVTGLVVEKTTGLPEAPPVALSAKGGAPNITDAGGAKPVIAWGSSGAYAKLIAVQRPTKLKPSVTINRRVLG